MREAGRQAGRKNESFLLLSLGIKRDDYNSELRYFLGVLEQVE